LDIHIKLYKLRVTNGDFDEVTSIPYKKLDTLITAPYHPLKCT